jgi:tetratricopeptide (TPR) repeat protein
MTRRPFSTSPLYLQSIRGLLRLHALTLEGQDESAEAQAILDSLERPWYGLSEAEKKRIKGLSEDLYSISDSPKLAIPSNPQATQKLIEAAEARQQGEWDRALELLRRWGQYLEPALLSYQRGCVWHDAGDDSTASLFLRHAAEFEPDNTQYKGAYLIALERSNPAEAGSQAWEILNQNDAAPIIVVRAGSILFKSTSSMDQADRTPILEQLIEVFSAAYHRMKIVEVNESRRVESPQVVVTLAFFLGACHDVLGDIQSAVRYFNIAVAMSPDDPNLLIARGVARYGVSPEAVDDLSLAVQKGAKRIWPHFFLAHHNLVTAHFDECARNCERALDFEGPDEVKALLHEWLAISRAELGLPASMVRSAFEAAVRLAPDSDEIRANFEAFEHSGGQGHAWTKPGESEVKALARAEPDYFPLAA